MHFGGPVGRIELTASCQQLQQNERSDIHRRYQERQFGIIHAEVDFVQRSDDLCITHFYL
jgi:hypothetical protein